MSSLRPGWTHGAPAAPTPHWTFKDQGPGKARRHLYYRSPYCYWCGQLTILTLNSRGQPTQWTATVDHWENRQSELVVLAHDACNTLRGNYTNWVITGASELRRKLPHPHWFGPGPDGRCLLCGLGLDGDEMKRHLRCRHCGDRRHQSKVCLQPLGRLLEILGLVGLLKHGHDPFQAYGDAL